MCSTKTSSGRQPIRVVGAAILDGVTCLATQRGPGAASEALKWEFPGGKVEPGEAPRAALVREIREELGVEIEVGWALTQVLHDYPGRSICLMAYECRIVAGAPRALECWQIAWVAPADIQFYPMPDADRPIARLLSSEALR